MPVYRLTNEISFPLPEMAEDDGLLAIGGDLSVDRLILAYSNGIFPWYNEGDPILWWCPKERYIIRPEKIHISHSIKKFARKHDIRVAFNRDFADVMHRCRIKREFKEGTWITTDMEKAYKELFDRGLAICAESYIDDELAGGLYGVSLGRCFFGESMYTDKENGSKIALISLANLLKEMNYVFIDCQFHTDHLESMGGERISYSDYMKLMEEGLKT